MEKNIFFAPVFYPMKNNIKILALDIGNVCVKIDFANFAHTLKIAEIPQELIALQRELECGRIDDKTFLSAVSDTCCCSYPDALYAFNSILIAPISGMVELVSSLNSYGYEARFFSDISPTHLARTKEIFPAAATVPDGMFSFVSGAQKPDEIMFTAFEERFGIPALYVDDRMELISAARTRGWNSRQFTTAHDLLTNLEEKASC